MLANLLKLHINWLYDTHFAMPALIIVSVWKLIGYNMVIFLSSLSAISNSLFEAAKIDGANTFQTFKKVTIPLLSPTIFFVVIITAISSFQVFDLIYLMTQAGLWTAQTFWSMRFTKTLLNTLTSEKPVL